MAPSLVKEVDKLGKNDHYYARTKDPKLLELSSCGGVVPEILRFVLEEKIVDFALTVKRGDTAYTGVPLYLYDPNKVYDVAGAFTISPINMAKLLRDYTKKEERIAVTVKPCEARGINYLIKRGYFNRENILLIGLNCGGIFHPIALQKALIEKNINPKELLKIKYLEDGILLYFKDDRSVKIKEKEFIQATGLREVCQRCLTPIPQDVDITCGYWGLLPEYSKHTYIIPLTDRGVEILNKMVKKNKIITTPAPEEGVKLRERTISAVTQAARITRENHYKTLDKTPIERLLSRCQLCLECWHACPIRSEKEIQVWRKDISPVLWQISVIAYMIDKCVECGACEDVCPMNIPFCLIIQRLRDLRKELVL